MNEVLIGEAICWDGVPRKVIRKTQPGMSGTVFNRYVSVDGEDVLVVTETIAGQLYAMSYDVWQARQFDWIGTATW